MRRNYLTGEYQLSKAEYLCAKYYALQYDLFKDKGYTSKVAKIEQAAKEADAECWQWLLDAVTTNDAQYQISFPYCDKVFYKIRRRFYYILSHKIR